MRGSHQASVVTNPSKTMDAPSEHASALLQQLSRLLWVAGMALWRLSIPALLFFAALAPRWSLAHTLDLVTDESTYIRIGRLDYTLLITGNLTDPKWTTNYEAPSLPKLLMGFGFFGRSNTDPLATG